MFAASHHVKVVRTADECDAFATGIYQVLCSHLCCLVTIGCHGREAVSQAGTSKEYQWHPHRSYLFIVLVVGGILSQAGDDALYVQTKEVIDGTGFIFKALMAVGTDDAIARTSCFVFNAVEYGGIIVCYQIRYDDANHLRSLLTQTLCKRVGTVVQLFGQFLHPLLHLFSYFRRAAQCPADGCYANPQLPSQVLQRGTMLFLVCHS